MEKGLYQDREGEQQPPYICDFTFCPLITQIILETIYVLNTFVAIYFCTCSIVLVFIFHAYVWEGICIYMFTSLCTCMYMCMFMCVLSCGKPRL